MNRFNSTSIALAVALAFSAGAMAQGISKGDYQAGKENNVAEYKSAKAVCASLSGNANDICMAEAKGRQMVATAELDAGYKPGVKTVHQVQVAKAEADYAVAREHCDDKAGTAKDVCVEQARAAKTTAKADAKAQMKTSQAHDTAFEKSAAARSEARNKSAEARKDAVASTLAAQYEVAKEKCGTYAGEAKDHCLAEAKKDFGKS